MLATARNNNTFRLAATCVGKIGNRIRRNPYTPIFNRIAASTIDPPVGAWVWASGSQVWNGQMGTLIAKPRNVAQNRNDTNTPGSIANPIRRFTSATITSSARPSSPLADISRRARKSNVCVARYTNPNANNIATLPARV